MLLVHRYKQMVANNCVVISVVSRLVIYNSYKYPIELRVDFSCTYGGT